MNDVPARLRARLAPILAGTGTVVLLLGSATIALAPSAGATGGHPPKNPNCATYKLANELKVDPPKDGTFTEGDFTVKVDVNGSGTKFDFEVTSGSVLIVIVKGGQNGAKTYDYRPDGATSGSGLHAPKNDNGKLPGLSHITFCYDKKTPPTSPPTTAPTSPPTTAPTSEPTSPPTSEPTSPPTSEPTSPPSSEPTSPPSSEPTEPPSSEPTSPPTEEPTEEPSTEPTEEPSESESPPPAVPTDIDAGQDGGTSGLNLLGGDGSGPSALGIGLLAAGFAMIAGGGTIAMRRRGRHSA